MASVRNAKIEGADQTPPCLQKIKASKWIDVALLTGFAALLIIGILASTGVLNAIGTTQSLNLAYGMYAGAGLFLLAELIKVVVNRCTIQDERTLSTEGFKASNPSNITRALTSAQLKQLKKLVIDEVDFYKQSVRENLQPAMKSYNELVTNDLEKFVNAVMANKNFLNDPKDYLNNWADIQNNQHAFEEWCKTSEHPQPDIPLGDERRTTLEITLAYNVLATCLAKLQKKH